MALANHETLFDVGIDAALSETSLHKVPNIHIHFLQLVLDPSIHVLNLGGWVGAKCGVRLGVSAAELLG